MLLLLQLLFFKLVAVLGAVFFLFPVLVAVLVLLSAVIVSAPAVAKVVALQAQPYPSGSFAC